MTGLDHLGLLYDSDAELVDAAVPLVRETVADGGRVSAVVERRTARALRDAVGPTVAIRFTPPSALRWPRPDAFLDHIREVATDRGSLVLAQYSCFEIPDVDLRRGEEAVNETVADVGVTLLCACRSDARAVRISTLQATHPRLLRGGERRANPGYRTPVIDAASTGGAHVLTMPFGDTGDLRLVRTRMSAAASAAGLRDAELRAAVFAVHEAALLVCDHTAPTGSTGPRPCGLDVWSQDRALTVEVRGPATPRSDTEPGPGVLWRDPERVPDPLEYVRLFCGEATIREDGRQRTVRITTPAR